MDERSRLEAAVHSFNGHALDWRRVYSYVWERSRSSLDERLSITAVREIVDRDVTSSFADDVVKVIESGVDMLDYLRDERRIV